MNSATLYSFLNVPRAYEDEYVTVYRLEDMRRNCEGELLLLAETARQLSDALEPSIIIPETGLSLLWLHAPRKAADITEPEYRATLYHSEHAIRIAAGDGGSFRAYGSGGPLGTANEILKWRGMLLLAYYPSQIEPEVVAPYEDWLADEFKYCGRVKDDDVSVLEYFIRRDFPCGLVSPGDPVGVVYDNDIELGHLVQERIGDRLDVYMVWRRLPSEPHAVALQVFDRDHAKVLGADFVIGEVPATHHRIDLSSLGPGDYVLKMIVYHFETGASVPGRLVEGGRTFERELKIASPKID